MSRTAMLQSYQDRDKHWVRFNGMNYRYFIHSALIRMYSVYDKLGMILQDLFELELGDVTFESVLQSFHDPKNEDYRSYSSLPPVKKCNYIVSSVAYKQLYSSRQDFFHLLVKQDFMGGDYKEVMDYELMIAIIENSKMIYDLIESLDTALTHFHRIGEYHLNTKG
ncbi:Cthe_2314 family HEPN domain-containing protein [Paenibacillus sp. FSL K6-2393]|uniref:Cthe_2314 family HEPN domain-containing protein n=1 Tax=Paenibacillus sp. FSL K6-2393 TaxID=2921475 RepID=UPI0030F5AFE5